MIKERTPLAMYEVKELLETLKETDINKDMKIFIKKFSNLNEEKSKKLKQAIEKLEMMKLRQSDVAKIVDIAPEDATELNKIFTDTSLDADETNKILDTIKNIK